MNRNNVEKHNTAVVILNWNGRQFLEIFLPILIQRTPSADIWVADNASTDDSVQYLKQNLPQVKLVVLDQNYGYTGGYNKALEQINAKYYVLLNSDIEVTDNWLQPLEDILEQNDDVAAVQPKILSFAEKSRFEYAGASGGFIDALGYPFCRGRFIGAATELDQGQYNDQREIFWATGAAFMVRATAFKELGGLDENFFAHMEEIDLCWRFKRAGYKIMVEPQSTVFHVGGGTLPVWSPMKTFLNFRNNIAMLYKNMSTCRFAMVYCTRIGTDLLRLFSYLLTAKWKFAAAIFRGHREFWCMRHKLDRQCQYDHKPVSQIYRGSIVLRQIFRGKVFGKMMMLFVVLTAMISCGAGVPPTSNQSKVENTPVVKPQIIKTYPHATDAYTQGLLWLDGKLYESTGEYGRSSLRIVELSTGKVLKKVSLDKQFFAEGLEYLNGKLYQITWQEERGFIYDPATLKKIGEFRYNGQGWGLATDGHMLYMSNGTNRITVREPSDFSIVGKIDVFDNNGPVDYLNEMEWIKGKLWANIYTTNIIAVIDPKTGKVERYLDLSELPYRIGNIQTADVLNGIAYDKDNNKIYVTGKNWDTLFELTIGEIKN